MSDDADARRDGPTIDDIGAAYRGILSRFCTGVVVITARDEADGPVGMTVGSFSSVSMDPPLVAFYATHTSTTFPKIAASGRFCANILAADQHTLGRSFARSGADKFAGVQWTPTRWGVPRLDGVEAWIDCEVDLIQTIGDHDLVVGRVVDLGAETDRDPLLFYSSGFHRLGVATR
ncbi:flavin reductase family protein [Rhodococcus sp. NPDC003318]|uniref:flavin reductase family protein n=1 Tax=Rhodococcus sp. NPDC003318 TaxID=3364503 RepID=UPI0036CC25B2